jgi:hypothetical protein
VALEIFWQQEMGRKGRGGAQERGVQEGRAGEGRGQMGHSTKSAQINTIRCNSAVIQSNFAIWSIFELGQFISGCSLEFTVSHFKTPDF